MAAAQVKHPAPLAIANIFMTVLTTSVFIAGTDVRLALWRTKLSHVLSVIVLNIS